MILSLIVAASENNVIGRDNDLPWRLPDDLKYFRRVTKGAPIIMGRKNHESIGRVLPERRNIVVTRQDIEIDGCEVVHSIDEAVNLVSDEEEVFIIGGGEIYTQALPHCDRLYLTRVHAEIEGDVYLPEIDFSNWEVVSREEHEKDEHHEYAFTVLVYQRKN